MDARLLQVALGAEPRADLALLQTQEARLVEHVVEELQVLALGYSRHVVLRSFQSPARGPVLVETPRALGAVARGADPDGVLLVLGPIERPRDEVVQDEVGALVAVDAAADDTARQSWLVLKEESVPRDDDLFHPVQVASGV